MKSGRKKSEKLAGTQEYTYLQWIKNNHYLLGDKVGLSVLYRLKNKSYIKRTRNSMYEL